MRPAFVSIRTIMLPGLGMRVAEGWTAFVTVAVLIFGVWLVAFPGTIVSEIGTVICWGTRWAPGKDIKLCNLTFCEGAKFKLARLTACGRVAVFELGWVEVSVKLPEGIADEAIASDTGSDSLDKWAKENRRKKCNLEKFRTN